MSNLESKETTAKKNLRISIQGKEDVIALGRDVVRGLDNPKFIKILVSENYDELVFTPCNEKEPMSFKVPDAMYKQHSGMRIYSKAFVREVLTKNGFAENQTHHFNGKYLNNQLAIVFPLVDNSNKEPLTQ